jgi:hypothetical protein
MNIESLLFIALLTGISIGGVGVAIAMFRLDTERDKALRGLVERLSALDDAVCKLTSGAITTRLSMLHDMQLIRETLSTVLHTVDNTHRDLSQHHMQALKAHKALAYDICDLDVSAIRNHVELTMFNDKVATALTILHEQVGVK